MDVKLKKIQSFVESLLCVSIVGKNLILPGLIDQKIFNLASWKDASFVSVGRIYSLLKLTRSYVVHILRGRV